MNGLDLFSGIGSFSLGLERAGMRTAAFCEIRPFQRSILAKRWPGVAIYDDVCTLDAGRLQADGISVDVIWGGFPCQNVSAASTVHGGNSGLDGEQSGLWFEYARLIKEIRPRVAIIENVDRLAGNGLDRVLRSLAAIGYDAQWDTIPGWFVGAPQARPRIWIVAYPAGQRMEGLFESVRARASRQGWPGGSAHLLDIARAPLVAGNGFPQPLLRGVDERPPNWVDRLLALGNTVIPQIPELIGREIMSRHPAAFINSLAESRDFDLAIKHLQQTWNDYCDVREENARLREAAKHLPAQPQEAPNWQPTEANVGSACLSYRHDFGFLDDAQRKTIRFQAVEWLRAWQKEGAGADRDEIIERCAAVVDQANREGPYQAIAAASRIRALKTTSSLSRPHRGGES